MISEKIKQNMNKKTEIPITSKRIGNVIGQHIVKYTSPSDEITINHKANNREDFAKGAILAAEFIQNKKGVFSMKNLINNL